MDQIEQLISKKLKKLISPDYCEVCDVRIINEITRKDHFAGKRHNENIVLFRDEMFRRLHKEQNNFVSLSQNSLIDKNNLQQKNEPPSANNIESINNFCKPCKELFTSRDELIKHNGTEIHQRNVDCFCELCFIYTPTKHHMWDHLKGRQHKEKLKEKGRFPIDGYYSPFCSSLSSALKGHMLVDVCNICNIQIPTIKRCVTHYISKSHEIAVEKWLQGNQETVNRAEPPEKVADEAKYTKKNENEILRKYLETNGRCYICNIHLSSKDRHQHVESFPHAILCKEKRELLKKGITDAFLTISSGFVTCMLCSIPNISSLSLVMEHINSSKHIKDYLDWFNTVERITQEVSGIEPFYCKFCNEDLDGTSYANLHYLEESHTKKVSLYCKICDVSNATSELLELHNKSALHLEKAQPKDILAITPRPPKYPDIIIPNNYTDSSSQLKPPSAATNDVHETNVEKVRFPTNDTECACYTCNVLLLSKKEKERHVQSFPHSVLSKEKEKLLKEGISDVYLTASVDGIMCKLCSVILCNPHDLSEHTNSLKHSTNYFDWRSKSKKVTSESEVKPFYCKVCDQSLDGTSCSEQHYTNKYHTNKICNVSNATTEFLGLDNNSNHLNLENEQKSNTKSELLTISYTDFITLLSTTYNYCDNNIENKAQSSNTNEEQDSGSLKNKVFNELEKLVQKLYYSKQVPYDFGLKYLQKINKEVDEIISENIDKKQKQDFAIELDNSNNEYENDNEGFTYEYIEPTSDSNESHTIESVEDFFTDNDTNLSNNPSQTQCISDLLNEIINRKQEVVDTVEKGMLNEIECLLERIDNIQEGPVLEEILISLEGFNEELDANILNINSRAKIKENLCNDKIETKNNVSAVESSSR